MLRRPRIKRQSSFVLNLENLNRNDCCGLPLHKTMTRWLSEIERVDLKTVRARPRDLVLRIDLEGEIPRQAIFPRCSSGWRLKGNGRNTERSLRGWRQRDVGQQKHARECEGDRLQWFPRLQCTTMPVPIEKSK